MPNRLQFEQSPYLLQHRENPVDWRPWGSEAFQTAREEDKPVFLSIGYSTCHWCHVMAHEAFEDETVAEAINRDFIPIKVDREERPDVDAVYMAACVAMTGSGGWPLTVLLTPEQTLESMYRGGLFDHVGGGFARYSTDEMWLVPHFEKMLYDNALLALAYTEAYQQTRRPLYGEIVRRTLDYVLRELRDFQGGFYCGQDADSEGEEGKYYVFTEGELRDLLGPEDAEAFCGWYGVTETGNFAGKNILNLIGREQVQREPVRIRPLRERVYAYRLERTCLHRDDKVLAAWNGLMIAALARAGLALDEPRYRDAAVGAAAFLKRSLTEENGRLLARWRAGQAAHPGKLDDYAFCAWGLLELYGVTFRTAYLAEAGDLTARLLEQFFDGKNGGFYPYAADGEQLITRTKETYDGAMPSGNAAAALVLSRLARLTGEARWRTAADLQLGYLAGATRTYPAGHGFAMLVFLEELWPSAELVCAARTMPEELAAFLREASRPELTVLVKTPETAKPLEELAPFTEAYPIPETGVRYYLCRNGACARPVDSISEVRRLLEQN